MNSLAKVAIIHSANCATDGNERKKRGNSCRFINDYDHARERRKLECKNSYYAENVDTEQRDSDTGANLT